MLFSIISVLLSRDTTASSNQATQTNDNIKKKSSKQVVQKLSNASTNDTKEKSNEKIKTASTIKITNKNKEKQRKV
jgi:hypothetical protein